MTSSKPGDATENPGPAGVPTPDRDEDADNETEQTDRLNVGDLILGKTRLLSRPCATCIFNPGNPMHLSPGRLRQLVNQTRAAESYIVCHSTLLYNDARPAICRGFADRYSTNTLRVMERLWGFVEVEPPTTEMP